MQGLEENTDTICISSPILYECSEDRKIDKDNYVVCLSTLGKWKDEILLATQTDLSGMIMVSILSPSTKRTHYGLSRDLETYNLVYYSGIYDSSKQYNEWLIGVYYPSEETGDISEEDWREANKRIQEFLEQ